MNLLQMEQEMKKAGYTLEHLARLAGVSVETVRALFSGEIKSPSYELLNAIEKALKPGEDQDCVKEANVAYTVGEGEYTLDDYYALPDDLRAELIDGSFYVMEAPSVDHQAVLVELLVMIRNFIRKKKGKCKVFCAPIDVQLDRDDKTMIQPDILVLCDKEKRKDKCIFGAPDFVVEILSKSTRSKDMNLKLKKYKNAGVREYWIVDFEKERVITYFFEKKDVPVIYGIRDIVPIRIFCGELQIDFQDIMKNAL